MESICFYNKRKKVKNSDPYNSKSSDIFYDGDRAIIEGTNFAAKLLADRLKFFPATEMRGIMNFNTRILIELSPSNLESVMFSSNDLRLYNPFFQMTRRTKISSRPTEDVWGISPYRRTLYIGIPEIGSFAAIAYIFEHIEKYLKYATKVIAETPEDETCKLRGCHSIQMYYPSYCHAHIAWLSTSFLKKCINENIVEIPESEFTYPSATIKGHSPIFKGIIDNFKDTTTPIIENNSSCIVCNKSYPNSKEMLICEMCSRYIKMDLLSDDYKNCIITADQIKDGFWKNYIEFPEVFERYIKVRNKPKIESASKPTLTAGITVDQLTLGTTNADPLTVTPTIIWDTDLTTPRIVGSSASSINDATLMEEILRTYRANRTTQR